MKDLEKCLIAFFLGAVLVGIPIAAFVLSQRTQSQGTSLSNYEEWEVERNGSGRLQRIIVHRKVEGA